MTTDGTGEITPIEQRSVDFHGDQLVAVLVAAGEDSPTIYAPVRPLCELLGVNWASQRQRIRRDPVLSDAAQGVVVITPPSMDGRGGGPQEMLCLPIDFLHGWLFGISVERVRPELRDKIIRYQRDCYRALWEAFKPQLDGALRRLPETDPAVTADLLNVRIGINGVLDYLWQRQQHDEVMRRLLEMVRLDVHEVGGLIEPGDVLTERQRQTLYQLGLEVAALLSQAGEARNTFAIVFGGVKKRFDVDSYRHIARGKYREAHTYLSHWKQDVQRQIKARGEEPCIL